MNEQQQPDSGVASVQQTAAPAAVEQPVDAIGPKIDAWFARSFNDSPVSRDTAIFNYVRAAVSALKQDLAG